MVKSIQLKHSSPQDSILLVQMLLSTVILTMNCLEAAPVLVMAVAFGIHQLPHVDKVMKQADLKVIFITHILLSI